MMFYRIVAGFLISVVLVACFGDSSARQARERQAKAMEMWKERCKRSGEFIYRTANNVDGIYLLKVREKYTKTDQQFVMDDPYGHDSFGDMYLLNFTRGFYHQLGEEQIEGSPPRVGYRFVEAVDPKDGKRYRYTGAKKVVGRMDEAAPGVQFDLKRNPEFDLNIYRFVLERAPAPGVPPRYGVTYEDISTREEREYWIAGSSLKVIDLHTKEVMAERIGYMVDRAQGSRARGRQPWLFAADYACPGFHRNKEVPPPRPMAPAMGGQTIDFVEKVLKPLN